MDDEVVIDMDSDGIITILAFVGMILVFFGALFFRLGIPGEGTAQDSIARISQTGLIWQTWKVQLTNDHPIDGNPMQYGVESKPALLSKLQEYAANGKRVKIFYHAKLICPAWECSDTEVIYDVKE
jgi:hypothetical protein